MYTEERWYTEQGVTSGQFLFSFITVLLLVNFLQNFGNSEIQRVIINLGRHFIYQYVFSYDHGEMYEYEDQGKSGGVPIFLTCVM